MLSFRLITTGLENVHSVVGYQIDDEPAVLIQPKEGTKFSFEAMHDINGLSIPELVQKGKDREAALAEMLDRLDCASVVVWYAPFIHSFMSQVDKELGYEWNPEIIRDAYALAIEKDFDPPSYKLKDVQNYTGISNLVELYSYLYKLPEPKRVRRV